ncbi:hypothetical protein NYE24_11795 [Paenibacillus sp. FSL H7-0350]|uniref:hypothetical protein n=1 Tax=Paenibacillus sp. FSL H7-0350 TaxID=2975345 RepID=UPI0031589AF7
MELRKQNWRRFIDSDNAVAAALLAKMGYTTREAREVRREFLRMFIKLRTRLDQGRLALIMAKPKVLRKAKQKEKQKEKQKVRRSSSVNCCSMDFLPKRSLRLLNCRWIRLRS